MKFFKSVGWWMPDHEKHLQEWMLKKNDQWEGRLAYQGQKIRRALELASIQAKVRNDGESRFLRTAIDVGGHVGLWSYYLAGACHNVFAFEPIEEHRNCFKENVDADNVMLLPFALGDAEGEVGFHTEPSSSGDTYVNGKGNIPVKRLDQLAPSLGLRDVDLIKLDCEGYEYFALHGAEELIKQWKPVIVVEQKPGKAQKFGLGETQAVSYLKGLGMRLVDEIAGDYFLTWP